MLAPIPLSVRQAAFLRRTSKSRKKSIADIIREAIDLAEQLDAGNIKLVVEAREAFDALQVKQGRQHK